jgi:hypothetical protein
MHSPFRGDRLVSDGCPSHSVAASPAQPVLSSRLSGEADQVGKRWLEWRATATTVATLWLIRTRWPTARQYRTLTPGPAGSKCVTLLGVIIGADLDSASLPDCLMHSIRCLCQRRGQSSELTHTSVGTSSAMRSYRRSQRANPVGFYVLLASALPDTRRISLARVRQTAKPVTFAKLGNEVDGLRSSLLPPAKYRRRHPADGSMLHRGAREFRASAGHDFQRVPTCRISKARQPVG